MYSYTIGPLVSILEWTHLLIVITAYSIIIGGAVLTYKAINGKNNHNGIGDDGINVESINDVFGPIINTLSNIIVGRALNTGASNWLFVDSFITGHYEENRFIKFSVDLLEKIIPTQLKKYFMPRGVNRKNITYDLFKYMCVDNVYPLTSEDFDLIKLSYSKYTDEQKKTFNDVIEELKKIMPDSEIVTCLE